MRVSIPFRYFAHGRAKGAKRPDLHCVGETGQIEVPHLSASDRMEIRSPNLLVPTVSLPVVHGAVWHPVSGVDDTPVTSADEARMAALALADGLRASVPIRPTFPPNGVPTTPENRPVGIRNTLVVTPGDATTGTT